MNSREVGQALYRHFINYDYKLFNTFVFGGWECDFFAKSSSGYFIEVEVKISRSDFFADFKKAHKHKVFEAYRSKKTIMVQNHGISKYGGDVIIKNFCKPSIHVRGYHGREIKNGSETLIEYDYQNSEGGYIVNDWQDRLEINNTRFGRDISAPISRIGYINLQEHNYPNQYWFAVPKDLVGVDEIPGYAGLLYIDGEEVKIKKKAPFLHKRTLNLTPVLLKKYYNLWQYKSNMGLNEKVEMLMNQKEENINESDY